MNNCYCTCFNNNTLADYINNWSGFFKKENTYAIVDNQSRKIELNSNFNIFSYNEADIRKNLNFTEDVSKRHFWNSIGNRNIVWFYAHFRMLNFYISNPQYEYYWFFDDDVICDDWDAFLKNVKYDSDFLSYFCFKSESVLDQALVPHINNDTYSKQGWFDRFPGDKDTLPNNIDKYFGSFFPVTRYTNNALKVLLQLHNNGYFGYSEGFVPTTLNNLNLTLDTLILPDNTSRHYDTKNIKLLHKNQFIKWEWI